MTVPLIDWFMPGRRYDWSRRSIGSLEESGPAEAGHHRKGATVL